ncbi:MAG: BBE domain-containing protein [Armatimonadetes bacterium]|nr:BBE domain-containing protein [Armatimonadota bacterium]
MAGASVGGVDLPVDIAGYGHPVLAVRNTLDRHPGDGDHSGAEHRLVGLPGEVHLDRVGGVARDGLAQGGDHAAGGDIDDVEVHGEICQAPGVGFGFQAHAVLGSFSTGGCYRNYADSELPDQPKAYYGPNAPRLEELKARLDPDHLFRNGGGLLGREPIT